MKQKYIKPEIKKIEYTYEEAYGKKCDFVMISGYKVITGPRKLCYNHSMK